MEEISNIQDYIQKWLEAERDLAINGGWLRCSPRKDESAKKNDEDFPSELIVKEDSSSINLE